MKRIVASAIAVGCLAAAATAHAGLAAATGVNGSLHDMTKVVGADADTMARVCVFCHTPHHADSNLDQGLYTAPLWNRMNTDVGSYQPYIWVTPANKGTDTEPEKFMITDPLIGPSRLCMSCHDGVVAVDQHGEAIAQGGTLTVGNVPSVLGGAFTQGRGNLGYDLTKTHPIGFDYLEIRSYRNSIAGVKSDQDSEIVDPAKLFATSVTPSEVQGTYNDVLRNGANTVGPNKRIKDVLYEGRWMTCASCHEVHNKENATQENFRNVPGVAGIDTNKAPNYFLYAKQKDSLICLSCHVK